MTRHKSGLQSMGTGIDLFLEVWLKETNSDTFPLFFDLSLDSVQ